MRRFMRLWLEQNVTPGTPTGRCRKIFCTAGIALALARLDGFLLRRLRGRGPTAALPFPVASALRAALLSALGRATVVSGRPPALPVTSSLLTGGAAIPLQRVGGLKVLSTALQQAQPLEVAVGALR